MVENANTNIQNSLKSKIYNQNYDLEQNWNNEI